MMLFNRKTFLEVKKESDSFSDGLPALQIWLELYIKYYKIYELVE